MSPEGSVRTTVGGRELSVSNLDKVLYPATGFTKGQVIDYYARVAGVMLPHLRDRPLTMKRYPNGVDEKYFFEKHIPGHSPKWVRRVAVPSTGDGPPVEYPLIGDLPSLVWAANLAAIEFHVPLWHAGRRSVLPARPDHLVFDLDPGPGTSIVECCRVAGWVAETLAEGRDGCRPKTSGSKGLQLYVPLSGRPTWEKARTRAHDVAVQLEQDHPDLVVSNMRRSLRDGKVLIDWSQNHPAKTTVAVYSLRGRSEPTVSTPVTWEEVDHCTGSGDPDHLVFTAGQVLERIEADGDLFAAV
ncbi:MAG TPA: non-homologous end-joining DNA ligase [Acidimicrobiales bacterium]